MKNFKTIFILIFYLIICTSCNSTVEDNTNDEPKLSDYKKIEKSVETIINELKKTDYYNDFQFDSFKYIRGQNDHIEIIYVDETSLTYNNDYLFFDYSTNEQLLRISLHCGSRGLICSNRILALTYLKEFDINEADFDNSSDLYSYESYLKIISGTLSQGDIYAVFIDNKHLIISGSYTNDSISIDYDY